MSFDWSEYLKFAREIVGQTTTPANQEARLRSAISRSYYAAFIKARNYLRDRENSSIPETADVHRYVIEQFEQSSDPIRKAIGTKLKQLRRDRNQADYNDTVTELVVMSKKAIRRARQVINSLSNL